MTEGEVIEMVEMLLRMVEDKIELVGRGSARGSSGLMLGGVSGRRSRGTLGRTRKWGLTLDVAGNMGGRPTRWSGDAISCNDESAGEGC